MSLTNKRCIQCMCELDSDGSCPDCHFNGDYLKPEDALPAYTVLNDRYIVGKAEARNGEGYTYIAYDSNIDCVVEIREYFPKGLTHRDKDEHTVNVIQGCETKYKAFMSDFADLAHTISKFRTLSHIVQVYDVFCANNTVYYVFEHIKNSLTLTKYLSNNAGEILWSDLSVMIAPLLNTISILNASGIIHRGISPETILVTPKNELKIGYFSISAFRVYKSELESEIFSGYAAPEQYSANSWYGEWTDVYSVCAVIYRALTGTKPPEAMTRSVNDNLINPSELNSNIPHNVSDAVIRGMRLSPDNRIQSVNELSSILFQNDDEDDITTQIDEDTPKKDKKRRYGLWAALITGVLLLIIVVIAAWLLIDSSGTGDNTSSLNTISYQEIDSYDTNSGLADNTFAVPNFVNQIFDKVKDNPAYTRYLKIEAKEEYSEEYKRGLIFGQDIKEGTAVEKGVTITLSVSLGSQYPTVPDYNGENRDSYIAKLESLGIEYQAFYKEDLSKETGEVVDVKPSPGTKLDLSKGDTVNVFFIKNPEYSSDSVNSVVFYNNDEED